MAFFTDWVERLLPVRDRLQNNVLINDPENYSKQTGFIDFLLNPAINTQRIKTIQNESANAAQYRTVQITYEPHWGTEDQVTTDSAVTCDKNAQRRNLIQDYDVNLFVHNKFTLEQDYLRVIEDSSQTRLESGLMKSMRLNRETMDRDLLAKGAGLIGTNPAQGAAAGVYTPVDVINADGGAEVNNFDTFANDNEENFMQGPVAIIGASGNSVTNKYFNRLVVGNLNTNAGVDIREVAQGFGGLFFKDQNVKNVLPSKNHVLAIPPGLTQYYNYNLYKGEPSERPGDTLYMTMPDPVYPIDWDIKISWDNNCTTGNGLQGAWVVECFSYYDLFTVPTEAFGGVYSELNGYNGITGYEMTE